MNLQRSAAFECPKARVMINRNCILHRDLEIEERVRNEGQTQAQGLYGFLIRTGIRASTRRDALQICELSSITVAHERKGGGVSEPRTPFGEHFVAP